MATTATDYWSEIAEPDYRDCLEKPDNLRAAFHGAISLFHMHDWVWKTYEAGVRASFTITDQTGAIVRVHSARLFANALEQQCADFGRVRGIANTAKHLEIQDVRPVTNAPSHAANTVVRSTGYGMGGYGDGPFGGTHRIMLMGGPGETDMEFSVIIKGVYDMWNRLRATHAW